MSGIIYIECMMGKITTQSDAIFVMEKNITQLEDQLAQSETDKSR